VTGRRVVVTGIGLITPLGAGADLNWRRMLEGASGVRRITRFDTSTLDVKIAAEVDPLPRLPEDDRWPELGIHARFSLAAGREAWADAGLGSARVPPERVGVYIGSGKGIAEVERLVEGLKAATGRDPRHFDSAAALARFAETFSGTRREQEEYYQAGSHLSAAVGAEGPSWVCITACAAGNHALGEAWCALRRGEADVILAGGVHSQIDLMSVCGYATLGALSTENERPERASRPFDRKRTGFILGEGGGVLVLEELGHAKRRGARIRAELVGYGNTADAYRVTDPHPQGIGAELAMRAALRSARLEPARIGYINAHGTSTTHNDAMETAAIKRIFGPKGDAPPVSSTKSMVGHLIAAAGAVEGVACVRALEEGVLPPTANYENPDPDCDLDYVPNVPREARIEYAMNNSFGFGGQNIVTIFRRFSG
jgi:3-oxoacyl-[acyl-carrier-protein] synthase II